LENRRNNLAESRHRAPLHESSGSVADPSGHESRLPRLKVAVLCGGDSSEREVSLRSGEAVASALNSLGHEACRFDPSHAGWSLSSDTQAVFLALHGEYGEDGQIQEELERQGVCYTGCGVQASRLAFDKVRTKEICVQAGVATPRFAIIHGESQSMPPGWNPPVVIKPVRSGSSVGLQFVDTASQWSSAMAEASQVAAELLMEERITGREVTVAILDGEALPVVEVRPRDGTYDYHHKYTPGATEYFCPAPLDPAVSAAVSQAALAAFELIGGRDFARIDFMLASDQTALLLEINTLPGMTATSLFPRAAAANGMGFEALCERMLSLAWRRTAPGGGCLNRNG